jgi:hypothetical protein
MTIRLFATLTLLVFAPSQISAQQTLRAEIVDFGIYTSKLVTADPKKERDVVDDIRLVQQTDKITAEIGVQFGLRLKLSGTRDGERVELRVVTRFPKQGIQAPGGGKVFDSETKVEAFVGRTEYEGFAFEEKEELVPGEWTFEIYHGERKLAEKRFNVTLK